VNTFANSRTAFAGLRGNVSIYQIPLEAGMSIGMMLISVELLMMLFILLFIPGDYAGPCFIGFAIGESLGAAALRIAGGIFTKIADIGSDLMKIVFKSRKTMRAIPASSRTAPETTLETPSVQARRLRDLRRHRRRANHIHPAGSQDPTVQVQLLVWIFVMRIRHAVASAAAYFINGAVAKARYSNV